MYIKIHRSGDGFVVALCDEDLINKTFEDGDLQLKVTEIFYKGVEKSEEEVIEILKTARNINIVGEKSVKLALDNNIISKDNVIKIGKVLHAQVLTL